jgi:hypothetical protein
MCVCMHVRVCMYVCINFLTVGIEIGNHSRCLDFEMVGHDSTLRIIALRLSLNQTYVMCCFYMSHRFLGLYKPGQ